MKCFIIIALMFCGAYSASSQAQVETILVLQSAIGRPITLGSEDVSNVGRLTDIVTTTPSVKYQVSLKLNSVDGIKAIDVRLGTVEGESDLDKHLFVFGDNSNPDHSFFQYDNSIVLGMAKGSSHAEVYAKVVLHYTDGSRSRPIHYPVNQ